jgi:hypothetical protein
VKDLIGLLDLNKANEGKEVTTPKSFVTKMFGF